MNTTQSTFTPYFKRLTETRDLNSLSNIDNWCQKMSLEFNESVKNNNGLELKKNKTLSWIFNAYPLILAYQGKTEESEQTLNKIIKYWSISHNKQADTEKLKNLVDPSVNLARLHRLMRNNKFWSTFNKINRFSNDTEVELGDFTVGEAELQEHWKVLEVVSLDEQLKTYISESKFVEVLNLKNQLPEKTYMESIYLESEIISLLALNKFEQAEQLSKQGMNQSNCIKRGIYLYRLYESYKGQKQYKNAKTVMEHLIDKMEKTPLNSLTKLTFSSRIIEEANLKPTSLLVTQTLKQYQLINDEFNYGMLLCSLYQNYPNSDLKRKILDIATLTDYIILRKKIKVVLGDLPEKQPSEWCSKITALLNSTLEETP